MIDYEIRGRVGLVTIRRPEVRNAINGAVATGIEAAVDRIETDPDVWAGVLTGEGSVFCAGADLAAIVAGRSDEMTTARGGFAGLTRRARKKPLIAAVEGGALAGGLELALACDLIVASRHAVFGLPEVKRSLVAAGGGLFRLPRAVGTQVALEMILTGDPISAERAYHLGLVNRLVEPESALTVAIEVADRIVANAPIAVWESRRVATRAWTDDDATLWSETGVAASHVARSEDFSEGPRSFVEKRAPVWKGR